MRLNPNKKISRYVGFRGSGIYPVDLNALLNIIFLMSDMALASENPVTSRALDQDVGRMSTIRLQTYPSPMFQKI